VVIDEAQDMNVPQLEIALGSCFPNGRICVVGDDRQAIYGFRGAAQDGMEMMRKRLNAQVLGLTTTYRCPKTVVAIAAEIVTDYKAAPSAPEGIVDDLSVDALTQAAKVGDAILSRLNAPLMSTCLSLLRQGTPARIEGRDIGKQLVGMVRKLKAKSVPDFFRKLTAWGDKQKARLRQGKNWEAKVTLIEDQVLTLSAVAEDAKSVLDIETRITSLFQDTDSSTKPSVVLSSVHKAKGLEWTRVFLLEGTFKKGTEGEEANIYYVAVTRAKSHLTFAV
jgi:superfamily I DNA/RNA helicase